MNNNNKTDPSDVIDDDNVVSIESAHHKEQTTETETETGYIKPFKALGFDSGKYYFISTEQRQVIPLKASELTPNNLLQLADLNWWLEYYPAYNADGGKTAKPNWLEATNDLIQDCSRAGVYSPEAIKGRGFWNDNDQIIRHLGEALVNVKTNKPVSMLDNSLQGVYQRSKAISIPNVAPASQEQVNSFIEAIQTIYWRHESSADLLTGWIAIAPFCGLLEWRPHVWISGEHGCGKSDTALECISVGTGKKQILHAKDSTTEAGLRQTLKADSIPVVLDEMEPVTTKDRGRIDRILSLARNASSDDDAVTLKGSITGDSTSYRIRSMFCYASINTHMPELSDQSRTCILDIEKRPQTDKSKGDFAFIKQTLFELEKSNFGYALTQFMINRMDTLKANISTFMECAGDKFKSARDGKQYGTLLAGYVTLLNEKPLSYDEAKTFLEHLDIQESVSENRDVDATGWGECWEKMSAVVLSMRTSKSKITVSEALDILRNNDQKELMSIVGMSNIVDKEYQDAAKFQAQEGRREINQALKNLGIKYQDGTESFYGCVGEGIYLANKSELMKKALSGTAFETWVQYTKRVGQAVTKTVKINGVVVRIKFIPFK